MINILEIEMLMPGKMNYLLQRHPAVKSWISDSNVAQATQL